MSEEEKRDASDTICDILLALPEIQQTNNIILYTWLHDEVQLTRCIEISKQHAKNIVTISPHWAYNSIPKDGVIIMPWRAFTLSGKRIGRWGGWYDNFLREHTTLCVVGVCFKCQIFPKTTAGSMGYFNEPSNNGIERKDKKISVQRDTYS